MAHIFLKNYECNQRTLTWNWQKYSEAGREEKKLSEQKVFLFTLKIFFRCVQVGSMSRGPS